MHVLDLLNQKDRDFFESLGEGKMKDIDIEYQDYLNLPPVSFFNRYKITKQAWLQKYKDLLPKEPSDQKSTIEESMLDPLGHETLGKLDRVIKSIKNPEQLKSAKNYANNLFYHLRNKIQAEKDPARAQPILNKIKEIENELRQREQSFYDLDERYVKETQKTPFISPKSATAYQNLIALQKAVRDGTDAEIYFTGSDEPTMIEYPLARHLMGKYRAISQTDDRRRAEFLSDLADARKFDQLTFQYKDIVDRARAMGKGFRESLRDDEHHMATVTLDDGSEKKVKIANDEGFRDAIEKHFAKQGRKVKDIKVDWSVRSNLDEKKDKSPGKITKSEDPCWSGYHMVGTKKKNGKEVPNCVPGKKVNEQADDNPMTAAVVNRIIKSRADLLSKYGPEAVMQAINDVTEGDTDWQEIGSSDVSAYVKYVEDRLADQGGSREEMNPRKPFAEQDAPTFNRGGHNKLRSSEDYKEKMQTLSQLYVSARPGPDKEKIKQRILDLDFAARKQGVAEMDSQGYRGHRGDEDPGKGPEKSVKPAKTKDVAKDAEKDLAKAMDREHAKKKQQGVAEAGYNPLDDERREQRRMDQERAQFKRDELDFELRGEEERFRQARQQAESATWYLRINGRIWRKNGKPVEFRGVSAARRAGKTIKGRDPSKDIMLTTKPEDVTEASAQKPRFVDQHGNPLQKPAPSTPIDPEAIGNVRELPDGTRQKKTAAGWVTILGPKTHVPKMIKEQDDDIIKISKALDDLGGMLLARKIDSGETLKSTAKILNHQGLDAARKEFAKINPNERLQILKMLGSFGVDPKVFSNVMEQSRSTDFKLTKKYTMSPDGAKTDFYEVFDTIKESKTFFNDLPSAKRFLNESIGDNPTDTVEMDIPLLLRMLEFAREDAKTDLDLHHVTEKMIDLSRSGEALTMHNYENIVGDSDQNDQEDQDVYEGGKGRYWCKDEKRWKDR